MNEAAERYDQKIRTELQKAKSQIEELEARSQAEDEQAVTELISQIKNTYHNVEKKREEIETSAFEEMEQERTEIDAGIDELRARLAELDRRMKPEPHERAA
jgi:hypothetical protein